MKHFLASLLLLVALPVGAQTLFDLGPGVTATVGPIATSPVPTADGGTGSDLSAALLGAIPFSDGATPAVFGTSEFFLFDPVTFKLLVGEISINDGGKITSTNVSWELGTAAIPLHLLYVDEIVAGPDSAFGLSMSYQGAGSNLAFNSTTTIQLGAAEGVLMTTIAEPPAVGLGGTGVLWMKDVAGKTALMVRFATGASQQIALEP